METIQVKIVILDNGLFEKVRNKANLSPSMVEDSINYSQRVLFLKEHSDYLNHINYHSTIIYKHGIQEKISNNVSHDIFNDSDNDNETNVNVGKNIYILYMTGRRDTIQRKELINDYLDEKISEDEFISYAYYDTLKNFNTLVLEIICKIFSPVLISLKSYSAVDVDNNEWIYWGRKDDYLVLFKELYIKQELNNNKVNSEIFKNYPNKESFLLIEDAQWDFYASLFDKVLPPNKKYGIQNTYSKNSCKEESYEYQSNERIYYLLTKIKLSDSIFSYKLKCLINAFENDYEETLLSNEKLFTLTFNGKVFDISANLFVNKLRELAAILANTHAAEKANVIYSYKGYNSDERNKILKVISGKYGEDFETLKHSKLNKFRGNGLYKVLTEKLDLWLFSKEPLNYFIVVEGINTLINLIQKEINENNSRK